MTEYWTLVFEEHSDTDPEWWGHAVSPKDENYHDDTGMLVYRSKEAAEQAVEYQFDNFDVFCRAVPLGKEIGGIKSVSASEEMLAVIKKAVYVWEMIGFHEFSGTAARCFCWMVKILQNVKGETKE